MRDAEVIEAELVEIGTIQDDITRAERIVAWALAHPDEVPFALHLTRGHPSGVHEALSKHAGSSQTETS